MHARALDMILAATPRRRLCSHGASRIMAAKKAHE